MKSLFNPKKSSLTLTALSKFLVPIVMILGLGVGQNANAIPLSHVTDTVVNNPDGTFTYSYVVHNDSVLDPTERQWIRDWELPWFGDAGIANITSPTGISWVDGVSVVPFWSSSIETIGVPNAATGWEGVAAWQVPGDPLYQGPGSPFTTVTQALHWYAIDICGDACFNYITEGNSREGFGFTSNFDRTNAPYQASWLIQPVGTGDPSFPLGGIPNSPLVGAPVPIPAAVWLFGSGLLGLAGIARRKRGATIIY